MLGRNGGLWVVLHEPETEAGEVDCLPVLRDLEYQKVWMNPHH